MKKILSDEETKQDKVSTNVIGKKDKILVINLFPFSRTLNDDFL